MTSLTLQPNPRPVWTPAEREAWKPRVPMSVSKWAEKHRILRQSAQPGAWRNRRAPALVGIMDLCTRDGCRSFPGAGPGRIIRRINVKKCAQAGVSEAIRNVLGRYAHQEPCPAALVLPDEKKGRQIMKKNIEPMFFDTPILRDLRTDDSDDVTKSEISLKNGFSLRLCYAGSPSSLASDPYRIVFCDEVDKYPRWSGGESDPISLITERMKTYSDNQLRICVSTPTTRDGQIAELYDQSPIKLEFRWRCQVCGGYETPHFSRIKPTRELVGTPEEQAAQLIGTHESCLYHCGLCEGTMNEAQRRAAIGEGVWLHLGQSVADDGSVVGEWPPGDTVGLHLSCESCLWVSMAQILAEWTISKDDSAKLMNFINSWRGEVFEQQVARPRKSVFIEKHDAATLAPGTLPPWAQMVILTVDTQKEHFYWLARAWGWRRRSQRIGHGIAPDFRDLEALMERNWPYEGDRFPALRARVLGIDAGGGLVDNDSAIPTSRTEDVYRFAMKHSATVRALRGSSAPHRDNPTKIKRLIKTPRGPGRDIQVLIHWLDTGWFKDLLSDSLGREIAIVDEQSGEETLVPLWNLDTRVDEDYIRHMTSEHKVLIRKGRTRPEERWVKIRPGARVDYWDCEVYQMAMADLAGVNELPPTTQFIQDHEMAIAAKQRQTNRRADVGLTQPDGREFLSGTLHEPRM